MAWTPAPSLRSVSSSSTLKSAVSDENPNKHEDSSPSFENSNGDNISPAKNITQLVEHKLRLAKAQAEIDRILNDPIDPPFDMEQELKKVKKKSNTVPEFGGSSAYAFHYKSRQNLRPHLRYPAVESIRPRQKLGSQVSEPHTWGSIVKN